jgi:hypothetical protein
MVYKSDKQTYKEPQVGPSQILPPNELYTV